MTIVVDTGVLLAAIDADDADHHASVAVLDRHIGQFVVPAPVIAETAWQLEHNLGAEAEAGLLAAVVAGEIVVIDLTLDDYRRAVALIRQYADLGLGLVDASVIVIAERMSITTIATLDRRDFTVVRPSHIGAFEIVP